MEYRKQAEWLDMLPYDLTNENIKFLNLLDNPLPTKTNEVRKNIIKVVFCKKATDQQV